MKKTVLFLLFFCFCLCSTRAADGVAPQVLKFKMNTRYLQTFMSFIQPLGIYEFKYDQLDPETTEVCVFPRFDTQKIEPVAVGVRDLEFVLRAVDMDRFLAFIQPLGIYEVTCRDAGNGNTHVAIHPRLPGASSEVALPLPGEPAPTLTPVVAPTPPRHLAVLKLREAQVLELEKKLSRAKIQVVKKELLKHGRLVWTLELPDANIEKTMRKFLRELDLRYVQKGNVFTLR